MTEAHSAKVYIVTFGCQMNKLDSELLQGEFVRRGFTVADRAEEADIVLCNTCSVREHAESKVFSYLGTFRERAGGDPNFILGVIGCTAQRLGAAIIERFAFVKLVCGPTQVANVPRFLEEVRRTGRSVVAVDEEGEVHFDRVVEARPQKHHAYVSIMRGCNRYCAYCIVPYVRGREVSRRPSEITHEVKKLRHDGVREIVLLGQNVNRYGRGLDEDGASFADLLALLNGIEGIERIRFVTSHPADMTEEIFDAVARLEKVCEHIHMPAQSGSNAVLKRMNRGYTVEQYRDMLAMARGKIAGGAIASDFIVGFPGETEEDFAQTLQLVREERFQQAFMFKYSPRPGTRAAGWEDDVPVEVKSERLQRLLKGQQEVDTTRRGGLVGSTLEVLVEDYSKRDGSKLSGRTRQNDIVVFQGPSNLLGQLCSSEIVSATSLTLFGRAVP